MSPCKGLYETLHTQYLSAHLHYRHQGARWAVNYGKPRKAFPQGGKPFRMAVSQVFLQTYNTKKQEKGTAGEIAYY